MQKEPSRQAPDQPPPVGEAAGTSFMDRLRGFFLIRQNRTLTLAIASSLLLHVLAFLPSHVIQPPVSPKKEPLTVYLVPLEKPHPSLPAMRQPPSARKSAAEIPKKPVIALNNPPAKAPSMNFLDAVNKARERRGATESPPSPPAMGPFPEGTGPGNPGIRKTRGIFQILRMSGSSAEFSFLGWPSEYSNAHREVFEVDTGAAGNIKLSVVRKMIEIIRRYYKEDFHWDSLRLGREIILSARLRDTEQLEAFMLKEFFENGSEP